MYKICTLGSHSALQILHGAKQEGFETVAVCRKGSEIVYKHVADKIISVDNFKEFPVEQVKKENCIVIPHGSFIAYMGEQKVMDMNVPYYGNKEILKWESDRALERRWLKDSGLKLPKIFHDPKEIDRPVIVKFYGASGGKGYFIANSEFDFNQKIKAHPGKQYVIQEYIIGVPIYIHYFYSLLNDELEVMGFDKRYESNVDSIGRISARDQLALGNVDPSYLICGNIPIVIRESYLTKVYEMGHSVIEQSKRLCHPGLFGPFCLEAVLTPDEEFFVFEISARIVAGTNPYVNGSPYSWLRYNKPMSTGRRIAMDIREAISRGKVELILQ